MWPVRVPLTTVASVRGRPGHPSFRVSLITPDCAKIDLGHSYVVVEHLTRDIKHRRVGKVLPEQWHTSNEILAQRLARFLVCGQTSRLARRLPRHAVNFLAHGLNVLWRDDIVENTYSMLAVGIQCKAALLHV